MTDNTELSVITSSKSEMANVIENTNIAVIKQIVNSGDVDPILDYFRDRLADLKAENLDPNNKKDRARMRSFAASIGKSKKPIADMAADLQAEVEAQAAHYLDSIKSIKSGVKTFKSEMDKIRDEAKHDAVEWDRNEEIRKQSHTDKIAQLKSSVTPVNEFGENLTAATLGNLLAKFTAFQTDKLNAEYCEEYFPEYEMVIIDAIDKFTNEFIPQAVKREKDEAELAELREKQAAAAAKELADKNARAAALQAEQDLADEKERNRLREEKLKLDAENKLKQAAIDAENAEKKRLADIETAKINAENELKAEQERQQKIADDLSANKEHRRKINNEALDDMIAAGYTHDEAVKFLTLIAKNKIRNLVIKY